MDISLYRRISEETTKVVKHKSDMLYVKRIIRFRYAFKDYTQRSPEGQNGLGNSIVLKTSIPLFEKLINYFFTSPFLLDTNAFD